MYNGNTQLVLRYLNKKLMQKLIWLFALLTWSTVHAQMPGAGFPGGQTGAKPANIGHLYGKILDSDGKPMPYTSVIVLRNKLDSATGTRKDVLVKGVMTQNNGDFSLEELPVFGPLQLKISATGYKTYTQTFSFLTKKPAPGTIPSFDKDLGNIKLTGSISQLEGVTVTGTKPLMKMDMDKKVFNVEQNISSTGGTALDVMKNVPSVNVDIDGNVTMRNSAPQLFIDGRPTTLTLEQIPADAIESVEVITAPSAKYDASGGGAGILNIVLKKNRKTGYNGNIRAGVDKRGAVNGGLDFNLRQDKVNITASAMINQNKDRTTGKTDRQSLNSDPVTSTLQDNASRNGGGFAFGRLGLDYFMNNRTTLSISGVRVHGSMKPTSTLDIDADTTYSGSPLVHTYGRRLTTTNRVFNGTGLVLGMKHLFPHEGEELTIDGNYFGGAYSNNSSYNTNYYTARGGTAIGNELQKIEGNGKMRNITLQTDYVKPFNATTKLEAGLRAGIRHTENNNYNYIFDDPNDEYKLIPNVSSNYENNENVYAAYGTFSSSIKNFNYKLGLRAESSNYDGKLTQTDKKFSNSYPVSLFPTVFLSQKLKSSQELQLSYTRRINRPNFFQLIPFADSTDRLNITKGNPNLVPEFTQSLEFSYMKTFKGNHTLLASAYYKYTNHLITSYTTRETDELTGSTALINTYINANSSYTTGAEITVQNYLTKWWDISTNLNLYNSKINTGDSTSIQQDALWSLYGKFNSNFKLPAAFDVQLTATFQSKTNLPVNNNKQFGGPPNMEAQSSSQGYIRPFYGIDIAIKKSFMKSKAASVTLSVSDIFRSRKTDQYSSSIYFVQNYSRLRDPQMVKLNFAYRFGKIDASLFKRKSSGNGANMMDGMQ
jgi:ferric enterobactin receptor